MKILLVAICILAAESAFSCRHDLDCGLGFKCLNGNNGIGKGFCVKSDNYAGWGQEQRSFNGCANDFECNLGESCIKRAGQFRGICIK